MANTAVKEYDWLPTDDVCEFGQRIEARTVRTINLDTGRYDDAVQGLTAQLRRGVASGLADGRDDLVSDPALECLGLRLAAAENHGVQARLIDRGHRLRATRGIHNTDTLEERCCPKCDPASDSFVPPDDL